VVTAHLIKHIVLDSFSTFPHGVSAPCLSLQVPMFLLYSFILQHSVT